MDKRVQRVGNAACLGGISHTRSAIINLYEIFANDYLTVTTTTKKHMCPMKKISNMVKFIRKVTDSEQLKREQISLLSKSALNVILSNCTNSRPGGHRVYGDCICSIDSQKCRTPAKSGNGTPFSCHLLKNRYEKQASNCAGLKNYIVKWLLSKCTMCSSK